MTQEEAVQRRNRSLEELANRINRDYYDVISRLISQIKERAQNIKENGSSETTLTYLALCDQLLDELKIYIDRRKLFFMPYINELAEKSIDNHNCDNCSGRCGLKHSSKLLEFIESLKHINSTVCNMMAAILLEHRVNSEELIMLHTEMMSLDSLVNDLLYNEETHLLPHIIDDQKSIHAHE